MTLARRATALVLAVAATFALAACAPTSPADPQASAPAGGEQQSDPTMPPTCKTILPETLVADFESYGLVPVEEPFSFGDPATTSIPDGVECKWGNADIATDHGVQLFGWAPIDAAGTEKWVTYLTEQGWTRTEGDGLIYLSDPFEGVEGVTYAFGDGYVVLADSKEFVQLVRPR